MKEKNNTTNGDATIRQLMKSSKITAHENLKYRIMNQVETENALARKKAPVQKTEQNVLNDFLSIYGIMYAVLAVLAGVTLFYSYSSLSVFKSRDKNRNIFLFRTVLNYSFKFSSRETRSIPLIFAS
jgi:hypothetical protein